MGWTLFYRRSYSLFSITINKAPVVDRVGFIPGCYNNDTNFIIKYETFIVSKRKWNATKVISELEIMWNARKAITKSADKKVLASFEPEAAEGNKIKV